MSFVAQFSDVGVISCSAATLGGLAFLHVQLSFSGLSLSDLRRVNKQLDGTEVKSYISPLDGLIRIYASLKAGEGQVHGLVRAANLSKYMGDYQILAGPLFRCALPDRTRRIAVWFSWQMERPGQGIGAPLRELFECLHAFSPMDIDLGVRGVTGRANLEYFICRDVDASIRAQGRITIPETDVLAMFSASKVELAAASLCTVLEDAWKSALLRHGVIGVSNPSVALREWWLGN
jgi:hypothetical protein